MPLRLIIMRHAKSGWDDPLLDDHDRILNERGRNGAISVGKQLREKGHIPDALLCSTAKRTVETWSLIKPNFPDVHQVNFKKSLYLASVDTMLSAVQSCTDASSLLLLGHNPGIGILAATMASEFPTHPKFGRYVTAATLVLEFDVANWSEIDSRQGKVLDFIIPE